MACPTNVGVKDQGSKGKLCYDIPSSLQAGDCSFHLKTEGDQEKGIFQLKVNGELVRENVSKSFSSGTLRILKQKKKKDSFVVKVAKPKNIELKNFFD